MAITDIKEKANEVREERASSLKSFFSNCFTPSEVPQDGTDVSIENTIYIENTTDLENKIYNDNATRIENKTLENETHSLNTTYSQNTTYIKNDIYPGKDTFIENNILENDIYTQNNIPENATYTENNLLEKNTHTENESFERATRSAKELLENDTHVENDSPEKTIRIGKTTRENDTYIESAAYRGTTVRLGSRLGFTALGVLAVLIDEFPSAGGMLNVTQMAKSCGVARTTLIAQLRSLEKSGVIKLGEAEKHGRQLEILCLEKTTHSENNTPVSGSSSYIKNNNYRELPGKIRKNDICTDSTIYTEKDMYSYNNIYSENNAAENNTHVENDTCVENNTYIESNIVNERLSKSKITIRITARELYFTAKASLVNVDRLTNQCFQQFLSVKQAKGSIYAIALFHNLLIKSKDNPNAYVITAIKQGATPSLEDEQKATNISNAGETVFKKIGIEILQRDLEAALSQLSIYGLSQEQIKEDLDSFTKRICE